jgi:hypothetical protein
VLNLRYLLPPALNTKLHSTYVLVHPLCHCRKGSDKLNCLKMCFVTLLALFKPVKKFVKCNNAAINKVEIRTSTDTRHTVRNDALLYFLKYFPYRKMFQIKVDDVKEMCIYVMCQMSFSGT